MKTVKQTLFAVVIMLVAIFMQSCESEHNTPQYFYITRCELVDKVVYIEWSNSKYADYYEVLYQCDDDNKPYNLEYYHNAKDDNSCIDDIYYNKEGFTKYWIVAHNDYGTYETSPQFVYYSAINSGGGSNGGDNGGNNGGSETTDEWVSVSATGYLPYWYCPTDGTTTPSTLQSTSNISAYRNTVTGAYKVTWAYKEYAAHKGYNKIKMDQEAHTTYNSVTGRWGSCTDYYYYEFTIYD